MATLSAININRAGATPAYAAAAGGGDAVAADGQTFLHVKNGGGAPITVDVAAPAIPAPNLITDMTPVSVPNGSERMIGPFPAQLFADANGLAQITYSAVTTVTVAAFRLSQP